MQALKSPSLVFVRVGAHDGGPSPPISGVKKLLVILKSVRFFSDVI